MNIDNFVETQYRLVSANLNFEYEEFYEGFTNKKIKEILTTLHYRFVLYFRRMNERLPTNEYEAHYWADESRGLIDAIEISLTMFNTLKKTEYAFEIDEYYRKLFDDCLVFLCRSGGSTIPPHMEKVELYYAVPIFKLSNSITVPAKASDSNYTLTKIGEGSYAYVYKYLDDFYNRSFVIKRAKNDLNEKELLRFKQEYDEMSTFRSPYILEVFKYNEAKNEYIMEYMDYSLHGYLTKYRASTNLKNIVLQTLRSFEYIHSKQRLHRDISPTNILIKTYDDVFVVKVSDFGLIKIPDSTLTSINSELKGCFNDPSLRVDGFDNYSIIHETYALTLLIFYIMTGRTNTDVISNPEVKAFIGKGLSHDKSKRFQNVDELLKAFNAVTVRTWN